jgi:hypothetical protein
LPTPRAFDANPVATLPPQNKDRKRSSPSHDGLARHVMLWPTPRANDAEKRGNFANDPRNGLPAAAKYWPTPTAHEARLGYQRRDTGKKGTQESLTTVVINSMGGREEVGGQLNPT